MTRWSLDSGDFRAPCYTTTPGTTCPTWRMSVTGGSPLKGVIARTITPSHTRLPTDTDPVQTGAGSTLVGRHSKLRWQVR